MHPLNIIGIASNEGTAIADFQFFVDVIGVKLNRPFGNKQIVSNSAVGFA
jgi:hypothetical protein